MSGITSSHLSQLAQIASLTGGSQTQMASQAAKQAQFEQDVLRSYIGGEEDVQQYLMLFMVCFHFRITRSSQCRPDQYDL